MKNTRKLVLTSMFAALCCVATMVIRIPIPGTNGYIHPGDAIVILCGVFLGPVHGALAAGIGSALSDFIGGYFIYVPITMVIKGVIALLSGLAFQKLRSRGVHAGICVAFGGVIDAALVVFGYFVCEIPLYGTAAAAASMLPNLAQGIGGLVIALILYPALASIPDLKRNTADAKHR